MFIKLFNRFINLFIITQDEKVDMDTRIKSMLINFSSIFLIFIIISEALISLLLDNIEIAVPFLTLSIFSILGYRYVRTGTSTFHQRLSLSINVILLTTLATTGGNFGYGIIWSVFFPFFAKALRGRRAGSLWTAVLVLLTLISLAIMNFTSLPFKKYSFIEIMFFSTFLTVGYFTSYAFQFMRSEILLKKDRELIHSKNQNNALENMLNNLSHQIRTPLSNIVGAVDNITTMSLFTEQKELTDLLEKSSKNLTEVVNDLVMATKTEVIQNTSTTTFNLYNTLNSVFLLLRSENKKIKYNISLSPDIPYQITGNSTKIKQILLNIANSTYTKNNGDVCNFELKVSRINTMPNKVVLKFILVTNSLYTKLSNQYSDNFFNRDDLIKLNTGKVVKELNLELTQKMIEVEGYPLNIITSKSHTTFEFDFPFTTAKYELTPTTPTPLLSQKQNSSDSINIEDANILIVEDNISNQHILKLYIKKHVKKIDIANNGKEALDKIALAKFDLILMDVQMPILDGLKATQKIRELERSTNTHIPIIAVTANAFPEDQERCYVAGMDDYISKPFDPNLLLAKIKKNLSTVKTA